MHVTCDFRELGAHADDAPQVVFVESLEVGSNVPDKNPSILPSFQGSCTRERRCDLSSPLELGI